MSIVKTAQWRVDGSPPTQTLHRVERAFWKRAVRIKAGDTAELYNPGPISYGIPPNEQFTVGIHFRIESCYGGHATNRRIASHWDGGAGQGWYMEYLPLTGKIKVTISDGFTPPISVQADINTTDWKWWTFSYKGGDPAGLKLYYGDGAPVMASTLGLGQILAGVPPALGDVTNTTAMMFGGWFMATGIITPAQLTTINTTRDDSWGALTGLTMIAHIPGLNINWGGGLDINEAGGVWLDVSGNGHFVTFTLADATNSMAREMPRSTETISGNLVSLELSRHGSVATFDASDDETADIGDVVTIRDLYNGWCGRVEKVQKDAGGKKIRATGLDEQTSAPPGNNVFTDRANNQRDQIEDSTNLMLDDTQGSGEAGSSFARINPVEGATKDALNNEYGAGPGLVAIHFWDEAAIEMGLTDFSIKAREETMKDACSDVTVFGYSDANIPDEQTGMASGATTYILNHKPVEVISVIVGGTEVFTGFHVDSDNWMLIFDVATGGNVDIKYTYRDGRIGTAHSDEIEAALGKKRILKVSVGYVGQTPLNDIAARLLRGKYWILTIKPRSKKWYGQSWYPNKKIYINQTDNPFGINGYYFVTKVTWQGSLAQTPELQLEQYATNTGIPPSGTTGSGITLQDEWGNKLDQDQHNNRGFEFE